MYVNDLNEGALHPNHEMVTQKVACINELTYTILTSLVYFEKIILFKLCDLCTSNRSYEDNKF